MSKSSEAILCFNQGFNCSQAVLSTYCENLGLDKTTALKLSCAFGGGMGRIGETCGAVTGALMLIGLKYGKCNADDNESKDKTYQLVQKFANSFRAEFGSVRCKDILKFDISKQEEHDQARDSGVFKTVCPNLVKRAVEIVEDIL